MQDPSDDPAIKKSLQRITEVLQEIGKSDLNEIMKTQLTDEGESIAEIGQFMSVISSTATFKISKDDAMELAKAFAY